MTFLEAAYIILKESKSPMSSEEILTETERFLALYDRIEDSRYREYIDLI